jgi:Rod binding domain-containing protein
MFLSQMLQPMFETVKVDPLFGGGHGEEIMRSFMIQEYGKVLAKQGGFGIAAHVKKAMIEAQNKANANAPKNKLSFPSQTPSTAMIAATQSGANP